MNMTENCYSYSIDDFNIMHIYENDCILADIEDAPTDEESANDLFKEVIFELRGLDLDVSVVIADA